MPREVGTVDGERDGGRAMRRGRRPRMGRAAVVALALLLPLASCGGDEDEAQRTGATAADAPAAGAGTYVGEINGIDAAVAVVAAAPSGGRQSVKVYVCDGEDVSEWFPGVAEGEGFDIPSDDGDAVVRGTIAADAVTGSVRLADGEPVDFRAEPATGVAGLYEGRVARSGATRATSPDGGVLRIQAAGGGRLSATVTPAGGGAEELSAPSARVTSAGEYRVIVTPDGRVRGSTKRRSTGGGTGYYIFTLLD